MTDDLKVRNSHLCFSQEELQVSTAQNAVVLDVAREVNGAGAVHGAVNLHVAVNDVQVLLLVLKANEEKMKQISTRIQIPGEIIDI